MIRKNKQLLTAKAIRDVADQEDRFILKNLFSCFEKDLISFKKNTKTHSVVLKVQVEPQTFEESMTAVSASSIGLFITKVCQK